MTEEEMHRLIDDRIKSIYDKFLEMLPKVIASAVKNVEHHTAPETDNRLKALELGRTQDIEAHKTIQKTLDSHGAILQSIKEGIEARNWFRKWLKDWWLVILVVGMFFSNLVVPAIEKWIRGLFDIKG